MRQRREEVTCPILLHMSRRKDNSSETPAHGLYRSVKLFLQPIKLREISIMMKRWNYMII